MSKLKIILLLMCVVFTFSEANAQQGKTEILWDHFAVPHIYADNFQEMYGAYGWAQMQNHANLILKLYGEARGKAAEYWGEEFLTSDQKMRLFNIPQRASNFYQKQKPEFKAYLDAFVDGMNSYASAHPEEIGEKYRQVLPVTPEDVTAHVLRVTYLEFLAGEDIYISHKSTMAGSNAYAVAPSKSASNNSMLVINPHLQWSDFFLWYEAHLISGEFDAYGVSLVGMPSITMAFNKNLGWAHTINPIDASDRYELTLKGEGYLLDKKIVHFQTKKVSIKIRQEDGSLRTTDHEFKYSKHGPVVGVKNDKAYAVRIAGFENTGVLEQYHKMAVAKNFDEFESAVKMVQNPMFNIIYADRDGNIFYLFNGTIPKRKSGDFAFWRGTIDGTKSKYIWKRTHPYKDLPKLLNPPTGFIQNCNDAPWTSTDPTILHHSDYPAYMSTRGTFFRPQRAVNMIKDNPSVTYEQLISYKLNTGMEVADRFLDDLLAAVEQYPDSLALEAASVLKKWDRLTETHSKGAVLYARWWDKMGRKLFETPWSEADPNNTPRGLKEKERAVEVLSDVAGEVLELYGSLDVEWGEVYRYRLNDMDYPANGGSGEYGIFRTMYFEDDSDQKKRAIAGETFIAVVEFGEKVHARVLLSYGNATQPGHPNVGDQLGMLSAKKLRPALLDKNDVLLNTMKRETYPIKSK